MTFRPISKHITNKLNIFDEDYRELMHYIKLECQSLQMQGSIDIEKDAKMIIQGFLDNYHSWVLRESKITDYKPDITVEKIQAHLFDKFVKQI